VRYALWKLDPAREDDRRVAADLYETLHVDRPNITFRARYRELTGETLPEPSGILDVPEGVKRYPGTVEELLAQVEAGLAQLGD
jgi:hypothetical protein